jgi:hypothetical protein
MSTETTKLADELILRKNPNPFPFLRGPNFGYLSKSGYYGTKQAELEIDSMAEAGIEWVSLMVMLMQETFYSTRIYRDFTWTPSDTDLEKIIRRFQKRGIRVLLKPVIDILDSTGRCHITFPENEQQIQGVVTDYWSRWFESNRQAMTYYARLSKEWGVEAFTVGQELSGTDHQTHRWLETIAAVRDVYSGWVCLNALKTNRDKPAFIEWVRALDAVGFSNYEGVPEPKPTIEDVREAIAKEVPGWQAFHEKVGIPVYWAECGCRSVEKGALVPWEYRNDGDYDGELQAVYLEGFLEAYKGQPWWAGFQYWKWEEQQNRPHYHKANGDTGFTVRGKPAEAVLTKWCRQKLS